MSRIRKQAETSSAVEAASGRAQEAAPLVAAVETYAPGGLNRGAASAAPGIGKQIVSAPAQLGSWAYPDRRALVA